MLFDDKELRQRRRIIITLLTADSRHHRLLSAETSESRTTKPEPTIRIIYHPDNKPNQTIDMQCTGRRKIKLHHPITFRASHLA